MFNLGDSVWVASVRWTTELIQCPDCFGKRFLTVIMGDDSQVTVECPECRCGYEPSRGVVQSYGHFPKVENLLINAIELKEEGVYRYTLPGFYQISESDIFTTKEDAERKSESLVREQKQKEVERLSSKEKDHKTWAWNATYHRDCIRRAEKDLIYHRAKLEEAKKHKGAKVSQSA